MPDVGVADVDVVVVKVGTTCTTCWTWLPSGFTWTWIYWRGRAGTMYCCPAAVEIMTLDEVTVAVDDATVSVENWLDVNDDSKTLLMLVGNKSWAVGTGVVLCWGNPGKDKVAGSDGTSCKRMAWSNLELSSWRSRRYSFCKASIFNLRSKICFLWLKHRRWTLNLNIKKNHYYILRWSLPFV